MTALPTSRSLKHLRDRGFAADVVERWIPAAQVRRDLFGCIDIVALTKSGKVLWVQTTSASNMAARRDKLKDNEILPFLTMNGNRVLLHGWQKKNGRWACKEEEVTVHG